MIGEKIRHSIIVALEALQMPRVDFSLEHPTELSHGEYATNIALVVAKDIGKNPKEVAEIIAQELKKQKISEVASVEVAGPGFINFSLSRDFFSKQVANIIEKGNDFGKTSLNKGSKTIVEYTDPNPFKEFHIGHLMTNVIGESLASLYEWTGAEVKRACYQGDVGIHVACSVWALLQDRGSLPSESDTLQTKAAFLGRAYAKGAAAYKDDEKAKEEIREINKKIFERSDEEVNTLYDMGRAWSLDYFETIYEKLGTKFDYYFFESEAAPRGLEIVKENLPSVFRKSEGAVVFPGEEHGFHTRVFINKEGLPTYEAKELALVSMKYEKYPYDVSVVITANEINEYFRVLMCALSLINPELAEKTIHLGHGMLRLPSGKMSSRTGKVITAEGLLAEIADVVRTKMNNENLEGAEKGEEKERVINDIAVGAFKFVVLRQAIGRDIIFDFDKSLSFEGDSGPYLQYTVVRARSVLVKAAKADKQISTDNVPDEISALERFLPRFPEVINRAASEKAPQLLVTYLLDVASSFNAYYANNRIIDDTPESPYRLALARAAEKVLSNGLSALGIRVPSAM